MTAPTVTNLVSYHDVTLAADTDTGDWVVYRFGFLHTGTRYPASRPWAARRGFLTAMQATPRWRRELSDPLSGPRVAVSVADHLGRPVPEVLDAAVYAAVEAAFAEISTRPEGA